MHNRNGQAVAIYFLLVEGYAVAGLGQVFAMDQHCRQVIVVGQDIGVFRAPTIGLQELGKNLRRKGHR